MIVICTLAALADEETLDLFLVQILLIFQSLEPLL